jgi:hypothetical protein
MGRAWHSRDQQRLEHQERERIAALLCNEPDPYPEPETDWDKQAKAVLIPTPGYSKSYTEIEAELTAGGVTVPPGLKMLASAERDTSNDPAIAALKWRPKLTS